MRRRVQAHIDWLKGELSDIDDDLAAAVKDSALWQAKDQILTSAPGVGKVVSLTLLADPSSVGSSEPKMFRGKRIVWGGLSRVRQALYMATLTAARHNPVITDFYHRLLAAGKAKKVALIACMRKLLLLNCMVRDRSLWIHPTGRYHSY